MPMDTSQFTQGLTQAREIAQQAAVKAVSQFGNHLIGDAAEIAPVLTGALKASGTAEEAKLEGDTVEQRIGFNTDYAAIVHENLSARHDQGEAKYLSKAMQQDAPKFGPFVGKNVKEALG